MKLYNTLLALIIGLNSWASVKLTTTEYIEKYKEVAIQEMEKFQIPASITLAQGILESSSGNSYLATVANNHFGIKCHLDWKGRKVYRDDDEENECFRAYKNPKESFRDHSLFLKNRSRYALLFEEELTDYKAWAKGLKKAGYATNPKYPKLLIGLIEKYNLDQYDKRGSDEFPTLDLSSLDIKKSENNIKYIVVSKDETIESIALLSENKVEDILEYNELRLDSKIVVGQIIYLQPKRRKAARSQKTHQVKKGENMYSISQRYGVKLKYLYKRNDYSVGKQPKVGVVLKLR